MSVFSLCFQWGEVWTDQFLSVVEIEKEIQPVHSEGSGLSLPGPSLTPGQRTRILHAAWHGQTNRRGW